jgi:hypothetical protein
MQLIPRYLVENKVDVIANDSGLTVEYRPVYSRQLKIYRGIDNTIQFRYLNADQKPVLVTETPYIVIFDENDSKVLERACTVQDDGATATLKGLFKVDITENDLLNLDQQYLNYSIYMSDGNSNSVTYANRNFDSAGTIYLDGRTYPGPKKSVTITNFIENNSLWYAGSDDANKITAHPGLNGNDALHTLVMYTSSYIGNIEIQGTLDNQITGNNEWDTIETVTFDGSETEPVFANVTGVFSYLRLKATANPTDKVTKVLIRN